MFSKYRNSLQEFGTKSARSLYEVSLHHSPQGFYCIKEEKNPNLFNWNSNFHGSEISLQYLFGKKKVRARKRVIYKTKKRPVTVKVTFSLLHLKDRQIYTKKETVDSFKDACWFQYCTLCLKVLSICYDLYGYCCKGHIKVVTSNMANCHVVGWNLFLTAITICSLGWVNSFFLFTDQHRSVILLRPMAQANQIGLDGIQSTTLSIWKLNMQGRPSNENGKKKWRESLSLPRDVSFSVFLWG